MFGKKTIPTTDSWEISQSRIFDAPREVVWLLWCEPERLRNWWLPEGIKNPFTGKPPGSPPMGFWNFLSRKLPQKTAKKGECIFLEVEKRSQIQLEFTKSPIFHPDVELTETENFSQLKVYSILQDAEKKEFQEIQTFARLLLAKPINVIYEHQNEPYFRSKTSFEKLGNRTKVKLSATFTNAEKYSAVKYYAPVGIEQTFNVVEAELAKLTGKEIPRNIELRRVYDAHRDLTWRFWTDVEHLSKWWLPAETIPKHTSMDLRSGGSFCYGLSTPDGKESSGRLYYRDVFRGERLIWVSAFSHPEGWQKGPRAPSEEPSEILNIATFQDWEDGKTAVKVQCQLINGGEPEINAFNLFWPIIQQSWSESLGRLDEALKKYRAGGWVPR